MSHPHKHVFTTDRETRLHTLRSLAIQPDGLQELLAWARAELGLGLAQLRVDGRIVASSGGQGLTAVRVVTHGSGAEFAWSGDCEGEVIEDLVESLLHAYARQRARGAEDRYAALLEAGFEGLVVSVDGVVVEANQALLDMYGYRRSEMIGMSVRELADAQVLERIRRVIATRYEGAYETIAVRKDGERVPLEARGRTVSWLGFPARVASFRDLRREKAVQAELAKSEARLREAHANAQIGSFSHGRGGEAWWSETLFSVLGLSGREPPDGANAWRLAVPEGPVLDELLARLVSFDAGERWELEVQTLAEPIRTVLIIGRSTGDAVTGTAQDITERREAQAALTVAKDAALTSARAKARFLATMSHEIRTPLTGVIGLTELLLGTPLSADQRQLATDSLSSSTSLLNIIDDILDLARVDAGAIQVESAPYDLKKVIVEGMRTVRPQAIAKGLRLESSVGPGVPRQVLGDRHRLRQVLLNLLGNAVKFTEQGHIHVALRREGDALLLSVADTGIGMDKAQIRRIFQPFVQADASTARRYGGSGLGLSIAVGLCVAMGGALEVQSEVGRGTEFLVRVPGALSGRWPAPEIPEGTTLVWVSEQPADEAFRQVVRASGMRLDVRRNIPDDLGTGSWILVDAGKLGEGPVPDAPDAPCAVLAAGSCLDAGTAWGDVRRFARPLFVEDLAAWRFQRAEDTPPTERRKYAVRVLLAEDNPINQLVVRRLLESFGVTVEVANNGAEAVAAVRLRPPDLVLMDMQMPGVDGLDATRAIRRLTSEASAVPVVALTANALAEDRAACFAAGMDDFMTKPVRPADLERLLRGLRSD